MRTSDEAERSRIHDLYATDEFLNSNLYHEVDAPWKAQSLRPLVDLFLQRCGRRRVTVLDVGGGTGVVLRDLSAHLEAQGRDVRKLALDLSPGFLKLQKKNNPDLAAGYLGDIEKTPLADKEADLILLVDVIEHLYDVVPCYREIRRIAKYALIKAPLERNLSVAALDLLIGYRKKRKRTVGHVNFYTYRSLERELNARLGDVIDGSLANVFSYLLRSPERRRDLSWSRGLYCGLAERCFAIAPHLTSLVFNDFALFLVECGP